MRYVQVPQDITLVDLVSGKEVLVADEKGQAVPRKISFKEFVLGTVLPDSKFGKNYETLNSALKISQIMKKAEGGSVAPLEDADWEILREVACNPTNAYFPNIAIQIVHFIAAVKDAGNTPIP